MVSHGKVQVDVVEMFRLDCFETFQLGRPVCADVELPYGTQRVDISDGIVYESLVL